MPIDGGCYLPLPERSPWGVSIFRCINQPVQLPNNAHPRLAELPIPEVRQYFNFLDPNEEYWINLSRIPPDVGEWNWGASPLNPWPNHPIQNPDWFAGQPQDGNGNCAFLRTGHGWFNGPCTASGIGLCQYSINDTAHYQARMHFILKIISGCRRSDA